MPGASGAIGCIEVVGRFNETTDNFERLNWLIRDWTGATGANLSSNDQYNWVAANGLLRITFQAAKIPKLKKQ